MVRQRQRTKTPAAIAAAALLALAACGGGVEVATDEFDQTTAVDGPDNVINPLLGDKVDWWIESVVAKAPPHEVRHHLFVAVYPRTFALAGPIEPLKFDTATDDAAQPLKLAGIGSEHCPMFDQGCLKHMTFAVAVPDQALRQHVLTGYRVKIHAKTGESEILALPAQQVQQQLSAVDRLVAGAPEPPPPPETPRLGIGVIAATSQPFADLPRGVIVVAATAQSPAAAAGIRPGDLLLSINGEPIRVSADIGRIMSGIAPGKAVLMHLMRGSDSYSAKVQL